MKHKSPSREAGLIQDAAKLAPSNIGAPAMSHVEIHPEAKQWLTPDHQAVLATIARWLAEEEASGGESRDAGPRKGARP